VQVVHGGSPPGPPANSAKKRPKLVCPIAKMHPPKRLLATKIYIAFVARRRRCVNFKHFEDVVVARSSKILVWATLAALLQEFISWS
jgi:hypothetical protein